MTEYGEKKTFNQNLNTTNQNLNTTATWASLESFRKAMAGASDNPTSAEVLAAMNSIKDEHANGRLPHELAFLVGRPSKAPNCFWVFKLANGVFSGGTTQCITS